MESPFDVSALAAITVGVAASRPSIISLRNNFGSLRTEAASSKAATSSDSLSASLAGSQIITFNAISSDSTRVRTLTELDKFAERAEENRARIQDQFEAIAASMSNLQKHGSFLSNLATRSSTGLVVD
jgi:hypothetical protein